MELMKIAMLQEKYTCHLLLGDKHQKYAGMSEPLGASSLSIR